MQVDAVAYLLVALDNIDKRQHSQSRTDGKSQFVGLPKLFVIVLEHLFNLRVLVHQLDVLIQCICAAGYGCIIIRVNHSLAACIF